jgi:hypothetical protein
LESATELTVAVELFQPITTTFKSPAVCAPVNVALTVVGEDCGVAEVPCTNVMLVAVAVCVVAVAILENALTLPAASVACTR